MHAYWHMDPDTAPQDSAYPELAIRVNTTIGNVMDSQAGSFTYVLLPTPLLSISPSVLSSNNHTTNFFSLLSTSLLTLISECGQAQAPGSTWQALRSYPTPPLRNTSSILNGPQGSPRYLFKSLFFFFVFICF